MEVDWLKVVFYLPRYLFLSFCVLLKEEHTGSCITGHIILKAKQAKMLILCFLQIENQFFLPTSRQWPL